MWLHMHSIKHTLCNCPALQLTRGLEYKINKSKPPYFSSGLPRYSPRIQLIKGNMELRVDCRESLYGVSGFVPKLEN